MQYVGYSPGIANVYFLKSFDVHNGRGRPRPSLDPKSQKNLLTKSSRNFMKRIRLIFWQLLKISPLIFFAWEKIAKKNRNLFYYLDIVLLFRYWCRWGHSECRQMFDCIYYMGENRDPENYSGIFDDRNGRGRPRPSLDPKSQTFLLAKSIQNFMKRITD